MRSEITKRMLSSIILIPIALFFIIKGSFFFIFFMAIFFIVTAYEWHSLSKKKTYQIPGLIFLIISIYLTIIFRGNTDSELFIFLVTILICVSTDIGGYVFGKIFKGPKINKKISPSKTYAGSIGGYFLSIILVYFFVQNSFLIDNDLHTFGKDIFLWVLLISTISQIGDFIVSFFKRKSKVKNTGSILPGHGGLLDRTDGMLFALPFSYFFLNFIF
jgi:phosphatidate cytidylyltransferase